MDTYDLTVCGDCIYADANGWDEHETGRETPDPAPLALVNGLVFGEAPCPTHIEEHEECQCMSEPHFSHSPCDGCGNTYAGDRYDIVAVKFD